MNYIIKKARSLGIISSCLFALGGWFCLLNDLTGAFIFSASALFILLISLYNPNLLRYPEAIWSWLSKILFTLILIVLCFLLFFIIITPIGFLSRILGKKFFLQNSPYVKWNYWHKAPDSYWFKITKQKIDPKRWS